MMIPARAVTPSGATSTQLTYSIQINPDPLTALPTVPSGDPPPAPQFASLVLMATNNTQAAVDVGAVNLLIPSAITSAGSPSLTSASPGSDVAVSGNWSVTNQATPFNSSTNAGYLTLALTGNQSVPAGATVTVQIIDIEADAYSGNLVFEVQESLAGSPPTQAPNVASISIAKLPAGFYFDFLVVTYDGEAVAQVPYNTPVTLTWGSSIAQLSTDTWYTVYYSTAAGQQSVRLTSQVSSWTSPALTSDTTFVVVAAVNLADASQTATQYALSASVAVQQPDLVVDSLTLTPAANGSVAGLQVGTAVSIFGAPQSLPLPPWEGGGANYSANTDGVLLGFVGPSGSTVANWAFINAQYTTTSGASISVTAGGGLNQVPDVSGAILNQMPSTFTLPVPNGQTVKISAWGGNAGTPALEIWFLPLGSGSMTQTT